eukprot:228388-Chlamydomonas_euryale.AAC.1
MVHRPCCKCCANPVAPVVPPLLHLLHRPCCTCCAAPVAPVVPPLLHLLHRACFVARVRAADARAEGTGAADQRQALSLAAAGAGASATAFACGVAAARPPRFRRRSCHSSQGRAVLLFDRWLGGVLGCGCAWAATVVAVAAACTLPKYEVLVWTQQLHCRVLVQVDERAHAPHLRTRSAGCGVWGVEPAVTEDEVRGGWVWGAMQHSCATPAPHLRHTCAISERACVGSAGCGVWNGRVGASSVPRCGARVGELGPVGLMHQTSARTRWDCRV